MKSLQTKIFLFFVALLVIVQSISLFLVFTGNKGQANQEIESRLNTAKTIFTEQFNTRKKFLNAFAETASKDFGIKQVFEDDNRSLLVALNNHRKRIDADIAMAISAQELVIAQLRVETNELEQNKIKKGSEQNTPFRYSQWLASPQLAHLYKLDNQLYQLSLSPLTVGSKTIGWLAFGFKIDKGLAQYFKNITNLETEFLLKQNNEWLLIGSSNNNANIQFSTDIILGNDSPKYITISNVISEFQEHELAVVMYGLKSDTVAVLEQYWLKFLFLAGLTLLLSLAVAYLIAASITKPIKHLVKQAKVIASGNYQETVEINDKSELGTLANEFNAMQSAVVTRENAIKHSANHDTLTNLPNRSALIDYFVHYTIDTPIDTHKNTSDTKVNRLSELLLSERYNIIVCHLNLSRLKEVNETLGHDVGDSLIQEAANRLSAIPQTLFVSHVGADEFILLFENIPNEDIDYVITKIQLAFEKLCDYQGINIQLQFNCGIALFPEHSSAPKTALQMADIALHHARKNNQRIQLFNDSLNVNGVERLNLINDLKHAIADDQLELHYQPKLSLQTSTPEHVEALVRWVHPTLGMIRPDDFIHIAEQTGQINELTKWVFVTALKQYNQWLLSGLNINIAVNISAENLKSADFFDFICSETSKYNVPTDKITLEVTESAVVDNTGIAMDILKKLQQHGMKISIDDYGTGYSSLSQLKQLPVDELKIDRSFVLHLHNDYDDQTIVRSTIELAHNMGLTVVAEGIEDKDALQWLVEHGCELAQGYFISRPQPSEKITQWLLDNQQHKT